ncbi:hypothetical protein [Flammeovirga sp. SJP92]|uniref:hypothetical protein n=1 Tax=Flammeovirga sp. SJP92 TaxID=1775430 RepID=UPI000788461F|nr:hypothetical protein [Flammeovirga sp. SJP92]KXX66560.1 hypothetical protein AVL50_31580 [Flammeovirga sp. SJP92]
MKTLFETEKLKITYEFERVFLIEKPSGKMLLSDDFYGNPNCGLISVSNKWAIIGGEHLTVWKKINIPPTEKFIVEHFEWIHDMRLKSNNSIELLTDPWSESSAVWELDIETMTFMKIKDFKDYIGKAYCEQVEW